MQIEDLLHNFWILTKIFLSLTKISEILLLIDTDVHSSLTKIEKMTIFRINLLFNVCFTLCQYSLSLWGLYLQKNYFSNKNLLEGKDCLVLFSFLQSLPSAQFLEYSNHSKIAERMSSTSQSLEYRCLTASCCALVALMQCSRSRKHYSHVLNYLMFCQYDQFLKKILLAFKYRLSNHILL